MKDVRKKISLSAAELDYVLLTYALQVAQLIILNVDSDGEEQPSVAAVDQFVIVVLDEICVFFVPGGHQTVHLCLDPGLLRLRLVITGGVVSREDVIPIRGGR